MYELYLTILVLSFWLSYIFISLEGGASNDPCSEIFAGPKPFSEPETLALSEFIKTLNLQFYIAFHSYSQQILYPFVSKHDKHVMCFVSKFFFQGYNTRHAPNYDDLVSC